MTEAGLAESTLAVTSPPQDLPMVVRPDWTKLRFGEPVQVIETGRLGEVDIGPVHHHRQRAAVKLPR